MSFYHGRNVVLIVPQSARCVHLVSVWWAVQLFTLCKHQHEYDMYKHSAQSLVHSRNNREPLPSFPAVATAVRDLITPIRDGCLQPPVLEISKSIYTPARGIDQKCKMNTPVSCLDIFTCSLLPYIQVSTPWQHRRLHNLRAYNSTSWSSDLSAHPYPVHAPLVGSLTSRLVLRTWSKQCSLFHLPRKSCPITT